MSRPFKYLLHAVVVGALTLMVALVQGRARAVAPAGTQAGAVAAPSPTTTPLAPNQFTLEKAEPATVARGERVSVSGKFPEQVEKAVVQLRRTEWAQSAAPDAADESRQEAAQLIQVEQVTLNAPQPSLSFVVPFGIPLGRYQILVSFTQKGATAGPFIAPVTPDGMLHVITRDPVKISGVYPAVSYPDKEHFEFKVLGEGFSPVPEDNALVVEGRGLVAACPREQTADDCVNVEVSDNGHELRFWNIPLRKYQGQLNVRVRVGEKYSDKPIGVTLARVGKRYPAAIAAVLLLSLIALLFWMLRRRRRAIVGGESPGLLSAIFLDTETNTYSLSKFQFYAWTAAALFGYIYLTISRSWVQGDFSFADIPRNLPGIIFISASTTVLAVGIANSKGSKGAGEMHPSLADFISSGGVITAERLQFFVWTILGVCAFIFLTLSIEPGNIHQLPPVPENFLYLMGISSFGYLGGKLARKPGPVISQIEAETGSLTLTIHGSNLSPDASFRIDDADVPAKLLDSAKHPDGRPQVVTPEDPDQPGFAKVLRLVINTTDPTTQEWLTGKHTFTLTNPDGQRASWNFSLTPTQTAPAPAGEAGEPGQTPAKPEQAPADQPADQPQAPPAQAAATGAGEPQPQAGGGPTITDVAPASGSIDGGTPVVISGTNFTSTAAVSFGETQALTVTVLSPTAIIAQSPPHAAGAVAVTVRNPDGGSAVSADVYTYAEDAGGGSGLAPEQGA